MKTALFTNFSNEAFTGSWDGRTKTFKAGDSVSMPEYLARHFAKHLANRELLRNGFDRDTSPKEKVGPDGKMFVDNDNFNKFFNKAFKLDGVESDMMAEATPEVQMAVAKNNQEQHSNLLPDTRTVEQASHQDGNKNVGVQVILPPDFAEDEEDEFEGKPQDGNNE